MTARPLLLGIDEGTSAVKVVAYDLDLRPVATATRTVAVTHPRTGWVEQDPEQVLAAVVDAVAAVLDEADGTVVACGIDHQGESVLAWDAESGRALSPIVVWQDKRCEGLLAALSPSDTREVTHRSGLPIDAYFSAGKMAWLLAEGGLPRTADVRLGTVDAFLGDRLGVGHATDASTASRTQLSGVVGSGETGWDPRLLTIFGVPAASLPAIMDSAGELGELRHPRWRQPLPLHARVVDQQAALAGSGCVRAGQVKATYGTGVFVLAHLGDRRPGTDVRESGLLPTVAWHIAGQTQYAVEGGVFTAGAFLRWLSQDLGLAADPAALLDLARTVPDAAGVRILPALAGLGAPWWRPGARGVVAGIGLETGRANVARAAVEAITWRVADIMAAVGPLMPVDRLRIGGGLSAHPLLAALQADVLGIPVERMEADATCAGVAGLAAVGAGIWSTTDQIAARIRPAERVTPTLSPGPAADRAAWARFVERAAALLE